jgi:carboxypeptidase C (cathepsin A)
MRPWICYRLVLMIVLGIMAQAMPARAADSADSSKPDAKKSDEPPPPAHFKPEEQTTRGSVTIGGQHIDYEAHAGTLVVHPKDWDDVPQNAPPDEDKNPRPEASMFYVAYFKSEGDKSAKAPAAAERPITFVFNGGPGSSTVWLHMGAFGPRRVVTADDTHTPAAPYSAVNNNYSLLDVSDLVFIDAPAFRASPARTVKRPSMASIPMRRRLPISSSSFCRSTVAGIRPSTFLARATAPRVPRP